MDDLYAFQGSVYLTAPISDDPDEGRGIFRIRPGSAPVLLAKILKFSWLTDPPLRFAPAGDRLLFGLAFFAASDGVHGRELWESDGTPEGTRMVADMAPGGYAAIPAPSLTLANGYLFFAADDGKAGPEPWALPLSP